MRAPGSKRPFSVQFMTRVLRAGAEKIGYAYGSEAAVNSKHETRNPKQYTMTKTAMIQTIRISDVTNPVFFCHSDICCSNLFRISIFGFRISATLHSQIMLSGLRPGPSPLGPDFYSYHDTYHYVIPAKAGIQSPRLSESSEPLNLGKTFPITENGLHMRKRNLIAQWVFLCRACDLTL